MKTVRKNVAIAAIIAIAFAITACPEPDPVIVTKTVTVTFPAFTAGTTLNLTPTYTPTDGWGEFSQADITYTVTSDLPKTYDGSNVFTANISDGYQNSTTYTFTQTFTGKTVGSQVIKARVLGGVFAKLSDVNDVAFGVVYGDDGIGYVPSPQPIPPVTLTLSKAK